MIDEPKLADLRPRFQHALEFAQTQVRNLSVQHPDNFPMYTRNGKWDLEGEAWTNWCEGFLGGMMWLFYQRTGLPRLARAGRTLFTAARRTPVRPQRARPGFSVLVNLEALVRSHRRQGGE